MPSLWTEHRSVLAWTGLATDILASPAAIRALADAGPDGGGTAAVPVVVHLLIAAVCIHALRRRIPDREPVP